MDDAGWSRLTSISAQEFSRESLRRASEAARVTAVVNPLIKRGLGIRQAYVRGQDCQVQARATGQDGEQMCLRRPGVRGRPGQPGRDVRVDTRTAKTVATTRTAFHPAITYRPAARIRTIDGHVVLWDAPI